MSGIFNRKQPTVHLRDLGDSKLRATAELIDERIGTKHDDQVTRSDVDTARAALERSTKDVFGDLSQYELGLLRDNLDKLEVKLDFPSESRGAFATSLAVNAVLDDSLRACASAIAEKFGSGPAEVNLTELGEAKAALAAGQIPEGSPITAAAIEEIELFMLTGKGGMVTVRDVNINGKRFDEAFPLPGNPDNPADLQTFDDLLKDSGYDRIYFKGPDNRLYVALNDSGKVKVDAGMRVQMGQDGAYRDSGVVLAVVDINNSLSEATIGFWTGLVERLVNTIRGKLSSKMDAKMAQATEDAANKVVDRLDGPEAAKSMEDTAKNAAAAAVAAASAPGAKFKIATLALKDVFAWSGMVASAGVAAFGAPATALGAIATVGGGMTALNIYDYARARVGQDKSPVYQAMGVTVNREGHFR